MEDKMERKIAGKVFCWWEMNSDSDDVAFFADQNEKGLWEKYMVSFHRFNDMFLQELDPEGWLRINVLLGFMEGDVDGEAWKSFMEDIELFNYLWEKHMKPVIEY